MKTIKVSVLIAVFFCSHLSIFGQSNTNTTEKVNLGFAATIIKSNNEVEKKLGVSISNFKEKYQYSFEWKVDGQLMSYKPWLLVKEGNVIELVVTRYPGGDKSTVTYELAGPETDLPLYPVRKRKGHGLVATN